MAVIGTAEIEVRAKTDNFGKSLGGLGGIVDRAEGKLKRFGITSQDVAVILGAGLAGGAAFAAREVFRFIGSSIAAASALREQRSATQQLFEANSDLIESFAKQAEGIGFSERAALQAANTFGGFFQNLGISDEAAAKLGIGFTALAAEASSFFDIDVETAQTRLISGLRGEQEAVERLNVSINEAAVLQRAIAEGFGKTADEVSIGEKTFARALIIFEQLNKAQGDLERTSDNLANTQRRLNAEWENSKARLGDELLPIMNALTKAASETLESINAIFDRIDETTPGEESIFRLFGSGFGFRTKIDGKETNALRKLGDLLFGVDEAGKDAADTTEELGGAIDELEDPVNRAAVAAKKYADETNKTADAHKRLLRAIQDAERAVDRAETTLARAFEDAELRVDRAERGLAEAYEDRAERIADAEEKIADARLSGFRDIRDARERLRDFEIDSAQRIAEAEEQVIEVRRERSRAITDARIALERAQASGNAEAENDARLALKRAQSDRSVADSEEQLAQEKKDRDREVARLERDLAEARIDTADNLKDAQRDLARVYDDTAERIEEAQRDIRDAHRDSARAIADAQQGLVDAMREGTEAVDDASTALDRLADSAEKARTALQLLNEEKIDIINDGTNATGIIGLQHGGRMTSGRAYITGEVGPELVVPNASGTVVSNDQLIKVLRQLVEGRSQAAGSPVTVLVPHQDPHVLANALAFRLARDVR